MTGVSQTHVGTTDISPLVKNNTDRMNQLVRHSYQGGDPCDGDPDTSRDLRRLTTCQKQYRQNEPAGRVDVPTGVEVCVTGESQTCVLTTDISPPVKNNTDSINQLVGWTCLLGWRSM